MYSWIGVHQCYEGCFMPKCKTPYPGESLNMGAQRTFMWGVFAKWKALVEAARNSCMSYLRMCFECLRVISRFLSAPSLDGLAYPETGSTNAQQARRYKKHFIKELLHPPVIPSILHRGQDWYTYFLRKGFRCIQSSRSERYPGSPFFIYWSWCT